MDTNAEWMYQYIMGRMAMQENDMIHYIDADLQDDAKGHVIYYTMAMVAEGEMNEILHLLKGQGYITYEAKEAMEEYILELHYAAFHKMLKFAGAEE